MVAWSWASCELAEMECVWVGWVVVLQAGKVLTCWFVSIWFMVYDDYGRDLTSCEWRKVRCWGRQRYTDLDHEGHSRLYPVWVYVEGGD